MGSVSTCTGRSRLRSLGEFLYQCYLISAPLSHIFCCVIFIEILICFHTKDQMIDVRRDTEREDEIRAIKKAWEIHEPGRAAKVSNYLFFLNILYKELVYRLNNLFIF